MDSNNSNNKITIEELIEKINKKNKIKKEIEINKEIENLKKIILEKNKKNYFKKIKNRIKKINYKINNKINLNKIKNKNKLNKNKIISVVGASGVGKSSFCTIFAKISHKKTLIIDFDILNSSINSIFGIKKSKENEKKKLVKKVSKNIDMLCATKILVEDDYKKLKENFVNILEELKQKYELIIIDNSAECFFEYTKQILEKSDLILFLVEANISELKKSKNLLNIYINKWKIKIIPSVTL